MLAGLTSPAPRTIEELLGPNLAARLDRLDLLSRKLLSGKLPGERRSKRRGRSIEFDDFRNYVPGDDLRHIDWNIYARLDRLFIKLFREEQDLALHVVIDASASMNAGVPNKAVYAHRLAMSLGYVGLVNQNRVTATLFGLGAAPRQLAPMRGRANLQRLAAFLIENLADIARSVPGGGDEPRAVFSRAMRQIASARSGRGIMIVLSDFLIPDGADEGLAYLGASTLTGESDTYCVQVLSPGEIDPSKEQERGLYGDLRLTDVESGRSAEVTVTADTIARYRRGLEEHNRNLREACTSRGIAHVLVPTDTPIDELIVNTLRRGGMLR